MGIKNMDPQSQSENRHSIFRSAPRGPASYGRPRAVTAKEENSARPNHIPACYRQFDSLTVAEAIRLCKLMAAEESGLIPTPGQDTLVHCCNRDHPHMGNNSESLHVNPISKKDDLTGKWAPVGETVGLLYCHSRCKSIGSLGAYLRMVGPKGAADKFWTPAKIASTVDALRKKEDFDLGWRDWKLANGYTSDEGVTIPIGHIDVSSESKQSIERMRVHYHQMFVVGRTRSDLCELIDKVCKKRHWAPEILRQAIQEGLVSLAPSDRYEDDVEIGFAYRGFFSSSPGIPVRIIKTRLLYRNQRDDPMSRITYADPNASSIQIGDFSPYGVSYQTAKQVVFWEGEPDSLTWRHFGKEDAIICIGNINYYAQIPSIIHTLNLKGKDVLYGLDRDTIPQHRTDLINRRNVLRIGNEYIAFDAPKTCEVLQAIHDAGANIKLWMCPKFEGGPAKDVNDFLIHCPNEDPRQYAVPLTDFMSKSTSMDVAMIQAMQASYRAENQPASVPTQNPRRY